ncbi:MAG: hypothetical protein AAF632_24160 [Bacteroidota bacterium]
MQSTNPYGVREIKEGVVYFNNNESFDTHLFGLEYLGQISTKQGKPYLVLSGTDCLYCDENPTIRVLTPNNGLEGKYSYPGKIHYWENDELIYESRVFFGEILPNRKGIAWIQREKNDQNDWVKSTYFLEIANDELLEIRDSIQIDNVLEQVVQQKAFEIPGKSFTSEP